MNAKKNRIQVFGAPVSNDEIEALAILAALARKKQRGYKVYVTVYTILGLIMLLLGALCIKARIGVGYVIFICALLVLYMVMDGVLRSVKLAYRRMASALNDTNYTPVFSEEGVRLHADDETEQMVPWNEFDAWTRTTHGLWIISEKIATRQIAVYVNGDQTSDKLFEDILQLLKNHNIREEITEA